MRYEIVSLGIRCLCLVSHRIELAYLNKEQFELAMCSAIYIITGNYKCSSKLKSKIQNVKEALFFAGNLVWNNGQVKVYFNNIKINFF